ncbi:hypothetical protein PHYSODRAFT_530938, partial [Phytophthora sojae]
VGWAYKNPESRWACPALPVHKPGKENEWRQTIDFRRASESFQRLEGTVSYFNLMWRAQAYHCIRSASAAAPRGGKGASSF